MQNNYQRFFISLSIVIIYCVSVSELVYTDQYITWIETLNEEWNREFYQIKNKYHIAVGEESPAGQVAITHFKQETMPKVFRSCTDGDYTITHSTYSKYHPPKIDKWYKALYKQGHYTYHSQYRVVGFSELDFEHKIHDQSDTEIYVHVTLSGKAQHNESWYDLGTFTVTLGYDLQVIKVEGGRGTDILPIVGKGKNPYLYDCTFFQANDNQYI